MTQTTLTTHITTRQIKNNELQVNKHVATLNIKQDGLTCQNNYYPYKIIRDVSSRRITKDTFILYLHTDEGIISFLSDDNPHAFKETIHHHLNTKVT